MESQVCKERRSQSQCGAMWFRVVQWSVLKATVVATATAMQPQPATLTCICVGAAAPAAGPGCHSWLPRTTTTEAESACGAGFRMEIANH